MFMQRVHIGSQSGRLLWVSVLILFTLFQSGVWGAAPHAGPPPPLIRLAAFTFDPLDVTAKPPWPRRFV